MPKRVKGWKTKNKNYIPINERDGGTETAEDENRVDIDNEQMDNQYSREEHPPTSNDEVSESVEESKIGDSQKDTLSGLQESNLPNKESGKSSVTNFEDSYNETHPGNDVTSKNVKESEIKDLQKDTLNDLHEIYLPDKESGKYILEKEFDETYKKCNDVVYESVEKSEIQDSPKETFNGLEGDNLPDEEFGKSLAIDNKNSHEESSISDDKVSKRVEESKIKDSQKDSLGDLDKMNLPNEHCGKTLAMGVKDSSEMMPSTNDEVSESVEESKIGDSQKDTLSGLQESNLPNKESGKSSVTNFEDSYNETHPGNDVTSKNVKESEIKDLQKDTLNDLHEIYLPDKESGKYILEKEFDETYKKCNDVVYESVEKSEIQDSPKETFNGLEGDNLPDEEFGKSLAIDNKNSHEESSISDDKVSKRVEESKIKDSQKDSLGDLDKMNLPNEHCGKTLAMGVKDSSEMMPSTNDEVNKSVEETQIQDSQKDTLIGLEEDNSLVKECGDNLAMDNENSHKESLTSNDEVSESEEKIIIQYIHEGTPICINKDKLVDESGSSQEKDNNITAIDNLANDQSSKPSNNVNGSVSNALNSGTPLGLMKEIVNIQGAISNILKNISHLKQIDEKRAADGLTYSQEEMPISIEKSSENATEMNIPQESPIQEKVDEDVDMGDNTNIEQTTRNLIKYLKNHLVKTDELLQEQIQTIKRLFGDNNGSLKNRRQESLEVRVTKLEATLRESPFLVTTSAESLQITNIWTNELVQKLHMLQTSVIALEEMLQMSKARDTEKLKMFEAHVSKLEGELQMSGVRVTEVEAARQQTKVYVKELEGKLNESEARVRELENTLKFSKENITELQGKLQKSQACISELEGMLQKSEVHVAELKEKLQTSDALVKEWEGTLHMSGAHVTELEGKLQQSEARATFLEGNLLMSEKCVIKLREEAKNDKSRIIELKEEVKVLEACRENLEKTLHKSLVPQQEKRRYERNSMHDVKRYTPGKNKRKHYFEDRDSAADD